RPRVGPRRRPRGLVPPPPPEAPLHQRRTHLAVGRAPQGPTRRRADYFVAPHDARPLRRDALAGGGLVRVGQTHVDRVAGAAGRFPSEPSRRAPVDRASVTGYVRGDV